MSPERSSGIRSERCVDTASIDYTVDLSETTAHYTVDPSETTALISREVVVRLGPVVLTTEVRTGVTGGVRGTQLGLTNRSKMPPKRNPSGF